MLQHRVPRTVTEKPTEDIRVESRPIADYRDYPAYVLLGEPGAGKSSLFEDEAKLTGGYCISARDFIYLDNEEWREKTLFIDGLDEARAGKDDARTPLDAIRGRLNKLGCKRFRISCREADWLGALDNRDLAKVSPSQEIGQLYLDPLSTGDVTAILANDDRVSDADSFIAKAERYGLSGLLDNPQSLDMLIDAVKGGREWPSTKQQLYRLASEQLAAEFNDGHRVAKKAPVTIPALLDAAGLLCAIQLLANLSGFSEGYAQPGRISLDTLDLPPATRAALKTRLFRKVGDEYSYVHRSVAEYLAAHFIAGKIKDGLLVNRVLALTTGVDGGIVAALRGLMAWLAVLSEPARDRLIEIDPLGLVVYGDVQLFSTATKSRLLNALIREAKTTGFPSRDWHTTAFSALCTKDMASDLIQMLGNPGRSDGEQYLQYCLLNGLCYTETITELSSALFSIIRDKSYEDGIRSTALDAFIHQYPEDFESLLSLADDIRQGKIEETENSLLETLLDKLFPYKITAANVFDYLIRSKNTRTISYHYFWQTTFSQRLSDDDIPIVLDQLFSRGAEFLKTLPHEYLIEVAGQLLLRGLQVHGSIVSAERLYRWLSIGADQYGQGRIQYQQLEKIREWLSVRSDRYFDLLTVGLKQINIVENIHSEIRGINERLRNATPPVKLGLWWLDQCLSETQFETKRAYFQKAFWSLQNKQGDSGLSLDYFVKWLEAHPEFLETYSNLIFWPIEDWRLKDAESRKKWANRQHDELKEKLNFFHDHKNQIAEGSAHPSIFYQLAIALNHRVTVKGKSPDERLSEILNGDEVLITAAKSGLRKILFRPNLPLAEEIFSLAAKNQGYHYIRLPVLVCLDILYQENPAILETLSDDLLSTALAFCFSEGAFNEAWLKSLCRSKPQLVARLFLEYASTLLAAKSQFIPGLHHLAYDQEFREFAKVTAIPLLNKCPVRGYKDHISHLHYLLEAAIANSDKAQLLTLVEKKLTCKGMDQAQRIFWLATGLVIEPESYEAAIRETVGTNTERINRLSQFLCPSFASKMYDRYDLPISTKRLLIELLAPRCQPVWPRGGGIVTRVMEERDYVRFLLNNLAANSAEDAEKVLADLLEQPKLIAWHTLIRDAQQTQQISRRDALYKHPDAFQIIETLNNRKPANVADLSVLALECLRQLAEGMHTSNTDCYKQFWNLDGKSPKKPRYEEVCRNYLADRLKPMLAKYGVNIEPEAIQAEVKRVDIKLSFIRDDRAFYFPIEIKSDYNVDLWKNLREQLIRFYTISPETEGRGLYLVLWFNFKRLPTHPQGLPPPKSATELEEMLKATLTQAERKLIDVFVLDVSATTPTKPS
ncbi:NACHT domain-containing NTPase [Methylicorpusculum sp.]|uniref:NACHT domain-containing protein n=1 Tax=Methylicorpusculum sp. TaxID=2713644 RepID=UPI00271F78A1|nr:hypothetical protein [Methylicorpusculum sp.]MDO8844036.1 hypothetical protein [Methylicorpusculum sp.]